MHNHKHRFIYSIVIPSIMAIVMFIVAFYFVIIPMFERSMMEQKKEVIVELTNAAWSVLAEYNEAYQNEQLTLEEAQQKAAEHIGKMRYGKEQKDYFWVISERPVMVAHPYRPDLIGRDLSDYTDNHENKLFIDATELVSKQGAGVIQYYWQWKDDTSRIVPKLSYVKGFNDWQWIIGTGIYLEDVEREILQVKKRLLSISFIIIILIAVILVFVIQQSRLIENKRKAAEHELKRSIQKYKSLVDTSSESTLMLVNERVVFANTKFSELLSQENPKILGLNVSELFEADWSTLVSRIDNPEKTYSSETRLRNARPGLEEVVISVTQVDQSGQPGYIVTVNNVTSQKRLRIDARKLSDDIELSLQLMNQPVRNLVSKNATCELSSSIQEAAETMLAHRTNLISIKDKNEVIGVATDSDLRRRVVAKDKALDKPIATVMTSPAVTINQNALLYEAVLLFKQEQVSHLLIENNVGEIVGHISKTQCLEMQHNSLSYLMKEIETCTLTDDLKRIYNKVPLLIQALFTSTDNINSISRIVTSIADAMSNRAIELALKELGEPPCEFAFVAIGSEGRREQTLKTDQDNAIIFEDSNDANKAYFLRLGEIINEHLHAIGYERCRGDLMAGNPEWCNSLSEWKALFQNWIEDSDIKSALDSSIFFDLRLIHGNATLTNQLQKHVHDTLDSNKPFFKLLAKTVIQQKAVMDKKQVNIKSLLVPIVGYLRVLALRHTIPETNSLLRLDQLVAYGYIDEELGQEIENIYKFLMHLRIKWQVNLILDNDQPVNHVQLRNLTEIEETTLEKIVQQISGLQDKLKSAFKLIEH